MKKLCVLTKVAIFERNESLDHTQSAYFSLNLLMLSRQSQILSFFLPLVFLISSLSMLHAQDEYRLKIHFPEGHTVSKKLQEYDAVYADSLSILQAYASYVQKLRVESFLQANSDRGEWKERTYHAYLQPGPSFTWAKINNGNVDAYLLNESNVNLKRQEGKKISPADLVKLEQRILTIAENSGYPFTKVYLDSIVISEDQIAGTLMIEKGQLMKFAEVNLVGDIKITKKYLQEYLGIDPGAAYSAEKVNAISNRIRELVFLQESKRSTVTFRGKSAIVNLFLKPKKASRTDIIVGVLPRDNSQNPTVVNRPLFTIAATLDWNNRLGLGERIYFQYEQLRPQRQEGEFSVSYPYIFGMPFGVNGDLKIYRRDSLFLEVNSELGLQYLFEGNNYIKAFWENRQTNLLQVDTASIINTSRLPKQLDFRNVLFGLEWQNQQLNYRFNPTKGWATKIRTGFGNKQIQENNSILALARESFDPQMLYDSLNAKNWQIRMEGSIEKYFPIGQSFTLKTALKGGAIYSPTKVISNEQFRLGGNYLLRGFDEENFTASAYAVATVEYRLLLDVNSFIFAFLDYGYIEDSSGDETTYDQPLGIGAGFAVETKVGIFGFSFAVGSQNDLPLDFRQVKTHFGYINLF